MITAKLEIPESTKKALRALRESLGDRAIVTVLLAAAQPIRNAAIPKAPYVTGTLRRSIRTEEEAGSVRVGTDVPYAARIEYGFVGKDSRGREYNQAPNPYLRPAVDETKEEQLSEAKTALEQLIAGGS